MPVTHKSSIWIKLSLTKNHGLDVACYCSWAPNMHSAFGRWMCGSGEGRGSKTGWFAGVSKEKTFVEKSMNVLAFGECDARHFLHFLGIVWRIYLFSWRVKMHLRSRLTHKHTVSLYVVSLANVHRSIHLSLFGTWFGFNVSIHCRCVVHIIIFVRFSWCPTSKLFSLWCYFCRFENPNFVLWMDEQSFRFACFIVETLELNFLYTFYWIQSENKKQQQRWMFTFVTKPSNKRVIVLLKACLMALNSWVFVSKLFSTLLKWLWANIQRLHIEWTLSTLSILLYRLPFDSRACVASNIRSIRS